MFNQAKKKVNDFYQFDPVTYIDTARKIVAEHEKSKSAYKKYLSNSQPLNYDEIKDLYVKLSINRILY
jgi:hypothetical protein